MQTISAARTIGGYPIFNIGNDPGLINLKTTASSGPSDSSVPLGTADLVDIRDSNFFAAFYVQANLNVNSRISDWTDEPCKREDYLWKKSIGGKFKNINCVSINHVTRYWASPTGSFQQFLVKFREMGIEVPPTIVRVEFTRFANSGTRLRYRVDINPEVFGINRDAEPIWGSNSWHKSFIKRDEKKVQFIANLSKWAEEVQARLDNAFNKKLDAFAGMPEFSGYLRGTPPSPSNASIEDKLKAAKEFFDKNLLTEQQYNEQVKTLLNTDAK